MPHFSLRVNHTHDEDMRPACRFYYDVLPTALYYMCERFCSHFMPFVMPCYIAVVVTALHFHCMHTKLRNRKEYGRRHVEIDMKNKFSL